MFELSPDRVLFPMSMSMGFGNDCEARINFFGVGYVLFGWYLLLLSMLRFLYSCVSKKFSEKFRRSLNEIVSGVKNINS